MIPVAPQEEGVAEMELHHALYEALSALDNYRPRQGVLLRMRFGIDPFSREHTLAEIGSAFGRSRERIRQHEAKALRNLFRYRCHAMRDADLMGVTGHHILHPGLPSPERRRG